MKKSIHIQLTIFFLLIICAVDAQNSNYASFVNPFIGTGGHGHTFPGATVPFGMVQLSPDTRIDGSWDGCSGYHHSDSIIYGFSHTHLSGTGCSDYGDIAILPFAKYKNEDKEKPENFDYKNYASTFSHKNEKASAGYYSVKMDNNILAEFTATTRVGLHKYKFPKNEEARIVVQLDHRDKTLESDMKVIDNKTIEGFRRSEAWAKDQYIYFVIEFSEKFNNENGIGTGNSDGISTTSFIRFAFENLNGKPLYIKVGISNVSIEGARKNLNAELPHWDFDKVKKDAEALWNKELSKIEVTSTDKDRLTIFYTALYHTMIQPNVAMDMDGMYRGRDNKIHKAEGFTYYSVFSLWDTFRAAHPLYTIIDKKRTSDFINTFLTQYEQGGRLPVWELASNETDCMIGYHSVSVIADAMVKGIKGFDYKKAFEASKHSAMLDHLGLEAYKKNGVISMDDEHESVSKTLEYAYDDWCIAQIAKLTNNEVDYEYFMKRSQSWKNTYDPSTGFMRPRKNGGWLNPFDPKEVNNNFTEGNSWQYNFFVPQDIYGLIEKMGGSIQFENKLDELFSTSSKTTGREQADITGLIGQYAHGNEPSHHMAYLYNFIGKPSKTQSRVNQILIDFYKNNPDGLIGNEDCGQMSAWYVLSSLGFYQVTPGSTSFIIGAPLFSEAKIHLENGKTFSVNAKTISDQNKFISSTWLNNKKYNESFISYNDIEQGSLLSFQMNKTAKNDIDYPLPPQSSFNKEILIAPIIHANSKIFEEKLLITIECLNKDAEIYYFENEEQKTNPTKYNKPFYIDRTTKIYSFCKRKEEISTTIYGTFYKRPNNWDIKIISKYNPQYTSGGDKGIIDGVHGETNWRKGEWQGYQSQNFECVIDLKKEQTVSTFTSSYLQDTRAWIVMPTKVEYYTSTDNVNFKLAGSIENKVNAKDYEVQIQNLEVKIVPSQARYIKIKAFNYGKLPEWHQGAGGEAFIFVDEIDVK